MLSKFVPITLAFVSLLVWEAVVVSPERFWQGLAVWCVVYALGILQLQEFRFRGKEVWLLSLPPFLLSLLTGALLLFVSVSFITHLVIIIVALTTYRYLAHLYTFLFAITRYRPLALERFASTLGLINISCGCIVAYGSINFVNAPLWLAALATALLAFAVTYQFLWVNKIDEQHSLFAAVLVSVLVVEFFWSLALFPVTHFISGLSMGIMYYVITNLVLLYFLNNLQRRTATAYVSVGSVSVLAILLSAQWL